MPEDFYAKTIHMEFIQLEFCLIPIELSNESLFRILSAVTDSTQITLRKKKKENL